MRGNIPIPEIPHAEDLWLIVVVTAVRQRRTQQGKIFFDATARNASGSIPLKIWGETLEVGKELKPGLWGITGRIDTFQDRPQFVVAEYRPITLAQYREHQGVDPILPRAFTMDIETLALPEFRERVGPQLERVFRLGNMRLEQQQRYLEDIAAEEERSYQLGSLNATSGRVLSIAVHVGPIPGMDFDEILGSKREYVFGIDSEANEQAEHETLKGFLKLLQDFDCEIDEIVGHNILGFDLPFIFQRCLINSISVRPFVNLGEYNIRGVLTPCGSGGWVTDEAGLASTILPGPWESNRARPRRLKAAKFLTSIRRVAWLRFANIISMTCESRARFMNE